MATRRSKAAKAQPAPGKACGTCTLCCMVMGIGALNKPLGTWCPHCVEQQGCSIYPTRPTECAEFLCLWMTEAGLGEDWKPERCHFVITPSRDGNGLEVRCDPTHPDAWRKEPYYTRIMGWAFEARANGGAVVICVNRNQTVVAPEGEFAVGDVRDGERLAYEFAGPRLKAVSVVKAAAPPRS